MGTMSLSSPFRASHRRTRSHSSLSTPSSSPVPRNDHQWRSASRRAPNVPQSHHCEATYFDLPLGPSVHTLAQPPEKWDVDVWRRGKRARREPSSPSDEADMESFDEPMPGSPFEQPASDPSLAPSSAPSTPQFASSSAAFNFFPAKPVNRAAQHDRIPDPMAEPSQADVLAELQAEAFSDLRKTVAEAGEGFVRRMREMEERRSRSSPSKQQITANLSESTSARKASPHPRGRKRPSPTSASQLPPHLGGPADDEDSDVEIHSTLASASDDCPSWSPSKKRAVSLGAIGLCFSQSPPAPKAFTGVPVAVPRRDRSSSPSDRLGSSGSAYSSSDDDEDAVLGGADQARLARAGTSTQASTPPLSFSFSAASRNSSLNSLAAPMGSMSMPPPVRCRAPSKSKVSSRARRGLQSRAASRSTAPSPVNSRSDRAVAALSLALANGAGSVSDYEALRVAQGAVAMQEVDAGALWD